LKIRLDENCIELTERTEQGYLFGDKIREVGLSNVLIFLNMLALV